MHYFISYSRRDSQHHAMLVYYALEAVAVGPVPWLDVMDVMVAGKWRDQVDKAVKDADALLLLLTEDAVDSPEVKEELNRALRYKKAIIPLRFSDVDPPYGLDGLQEVDFRGDVKSAVVELRRQLAWLDTREGRIAYIEQRKQRAERDRRSPDRNQQARADQEIADLEEDLQVLRGKSSPQRPAEIEQPRTVDQPPVPTVNRAPSPPVRDFQDRIQETERIVEFLDDPALRLLTVVGRAGVGKTAMVCRALRRVEHGETALRQSFAGIVYLGAGPARDASFANVYSDLSSLLPAAARAAAENAWHDTPTTDVRVNTLATLLAHRSVVVMLDNFEDLLHPAGGEIVDRELGQALRLLLTGPDHGIKIILTTREAPRELALLTPTRQDFLELDSGLPLAHARALLRAMDRDGRVGLREAPEELLDQICDRTLGLPRALEAFFAVIRQDRFTSVTELLAAATSPDHVVEKLVAEAFSRLDTRNREVMKALAVYNRQVSVEAVEFLVSRDVTGSVDAILRRLTMMYLARHDHGRYYLHPADRAYALTQVEPGAVGDWVEGGGGRERTLTTMQFLAAEYFRAHRPAQIGSNDELEPWLAEFDLRSAAGDVDGAVDVLLDCTDVMLELGQRWQLLQLADEVIDQADGMQRTRLLAITGFALARLGVEGAARDRLRAAIQRAPADHDVDEVAGWRLELADCLRVLGETDEAVDELNGLLGSPGLSSYREASAVLSLAQIALIKGDHPEAAHLHGRALTTGVQSAGWIVADDRETRRLEELLAAVDLYDPTSWEATDVELVDEDTDGESSVGVLCSVAPRDEDVPVVRFVVTDTLLADIWFARAAHALEVDDLPTAEAACRLAGTMYEILDSFTTYRAVDLLNDISAELGAHDGLDEMQHLLAVARERRMVSLEVAQLRRLGHEYLARDRLQDAEQAFRELEQLGRHERDQDEVVAAQLGLARVALRRERPEDAADAVGRMLATLPSDQIGHEGSGLHLLAEIEESRYDWERALGYFGRARTLCAELRDWRATIAIDCRMANIERQSRNYAAAQARLEAAAALARSIAVPSVTMSVLADLLTARLDAGDRLGAREVATEAELLAATAHLPASIAEIEGVMGQMWTELEDYDAAVAAYGRTRQIYRDLGRRWEEVSALGSLAYVLGEAERYQEEYAIAWEALELVRLDGNAFDPSQLRTATLYVALALADLGRHDEATAMIDPFLHTRDMSALGNAGWVYFLAGRYAESLDLSLRALQIGWVAEWERNVAHSLLALGRAEEAEAQYRSVVEQRRGGEHFRRTIREVRKLLRRHPDLPRGQEVLALLESAQAGLD